MAIRIFHLDDDLLFLDRFSKLLSNETLLGVTFQSQ